MNKKLIEMIEKAVLSFGLDGFEEFFKAKLKDKDYYENEQERASDIEFAINNMKYDMEENDDSLFTAFQTACKELYIDTDGIEEYF